jgi:hypothetical protein
VDFTNVDLNMFGRKYISGEHVYELRYSIKVIFGAQDGVLKFQTFSQGQTIGNTTINFATVKYY